MVRPGRNRQLLRGRVYLLRYRSVFLVNVACMCIYMHICLHRAMLTIVDFRPLWFLTAALLRCKKYGTTCRWTASRRVQALAPTLPPNMSLVAQDGLFDADMVKLDV